MSAPAAVPGDQRASQAGALVACQISVVAPRHQRPGIPGYPATDESEGMSP